MFIRNGKRINLDVPLVFNHVQYFPNDLRKSEVRSLIGITELPDPERKDPRYYYVNETETAPYIINTPKSDEAIRAMIWEDLKNYRDDMSNLGGYKVEVETGVLKWFHSDIKSRTQQLGLVLLGANIPVGLKWKTMDQSFVDMTPTLAQQIFMSAATQDTAVFAKAEYHKAVMETIIGADNLAAYDWKADWPEVFDPTA